MILLATFAEQTRIHRIRQGITQAQLAAAVGVSRTSITNIESGAQCPSLDVAHAIAAELGVSLDLLCGLLVEM